LSARAKYRALADRYQCMLDTSLEGIVLIDADDRVTYANLQMAELLGYDPSELVEQSLYVLLFGEDHEVARRRRDERRLGKGEHYEIRLRHKDGSERWCVMSVSAVYEDGAYAGTFSMLTDITQRKRAEDGLRRLHAELEERVRERTAELARANRALEAELNERRRVEGELRASESRFRTLFEQSPFSMQLHAADGRCLQVNRAWESLWELPASAVVGRNIVNNRHPDRSPAAVPHPFASAIERAFHGETVLTGPVLYDPVPLLGGGRPRWVLGFLYPIQHTAASVPDVIVAHQDITDLVRAQQLARGQADVLGKSLRALTAEPDLDRFLGQVLRTVADQFDAELAEIWLDSAEHGLSRVHMTSWRGRIITAAEQPEYPGAHGLPLSEIRRFASYQALRVEHRPYVYRDVPSVPELAPFRAWGDARGGIRTLLLVPLVLGDEYLGTVGICHADDRPHHADELELGQALGQQIVLAIQLTRLADRARQDARQAAVLDERNRMAREIHDTLAQGFAGIIAQLQAARLALERNAAGVAPILNAALLQARQGLAEARRSVWALRPHVLEGGDLAAALHRLVDSAPADVEVRLAVEGTPRPLSAETEVNLFRIAQEALANALKHARARRVEVSAQFALDHVRLQVADDGCGFVPSAETRGFGLVSMRERADRIGARFTLTSAPGQGTGVRVSLPLARAAK
jgi:PAS domain S-box-containing protein